MIDEALVRRVARLARLALSEEEARRLQAELGAILDTMEDLKRVDTEGVAPTSHAWGLTDVLRPDEVRPDPRREELLAGAPLREGRYFRVPKVIE